MPGRCIAPQWGEAALCAASGGVHLVPIIGFELMTYRLQGGCSTN